MGKITPYLIVGLCCVTFYPRPAAALNFSAPKPKFGYKDASGKKQSIEIVDKYYPKKIVQPFSNDSKIDPKLRRAATIAEERARAHSLSKCWQYAERSSRRRRRGEVPAPNPPGKASRSRAGEQLWF